MYVFNIPRVFLGLLKIVLYTNNKMYLFENRNVTFEPFDEKRDESRVHFRLYVLAYLDQSNAFTLIAAIVPGAITNELSLTM